MLSRYNNAKTVINITFGTLIFTKISYQKYHYVGYHAYLQAYTVLLKHIQFLAIKKIAITMFHYCVNETSKSSM